MLYRIAISASVLNFDLKFGEETEGKQNRPLFAYLPRKIKTATLINIVQSQTENMKLNKQKQKSNIQKITNWWERTQAMNGIHWCQCYPILTEQGSSIKLVRKGSAICLGGGGRDEQILASVVCYKKRKVINHAQRNRSPWKYGWGFKTHRLVFLHQHVTLMQEKHINWEK